VSAEPSPLTAAPRAEWLQRRAPAAVPLDIRNAAATTLRSCVLQVALGTIRLHAVAKHQLAAVESAFALPVLTNARATESLPNFVPIRECGKTVLLAAAPRLLAMVPAFVGSAKPKTENAIVPLPMSAPTPVFGRLKPPAAVVHRFVPPEHVRQHVLETGAPR
jgi:hypothetical protein